MVQPASLPRASRSPTWCSAPESAARAHMQTRPAAARASAPRCYTSTHRLEAIHARLTPRYLYYKLCKRLALIPGDVQVVLELLGDTTDHLKVTEPLESLHSRGLWPLRGLCRGRRDLVCAIERSGTVKRGVCCFQERLERLCCRSGDLASYWQAHTRCVQRM